MEEIRARLNAAQAEIESALSLLDDLDSGGPYLNVPYLPQWGEGADQRRGDCGPACAAMIVRFLTNHAPTVDQMAAACNQPRTYPGQNYTNHAQLRQGAAAYGVTLQTRSKYTPPFLSLGLLMSRVDQGKPSIALIHYGVLRDKTNAFPDIVHNQDQKYARGHWVVFIGYDVAGVYIHDPDFGFWPDVDRVDEGSHRWIPTMAFNDALVAVAPGCTVGNQGLVVA